MVQVHLGPPLEHLVNSNFTRVTPDSGPTCLSVCLSTVHAEQPVHHLRAGLDHRPQLMPIDQLGHRRTAVTHQLRDVLYRHTSIGQH